MSNKFLSLFFLICMVLLTRSVKATSDKEKLFEQYFDQATYGQLSYADRMKVFGRMLSLVDDVSQGHRKSFLQAIKGLVNTRLQNQEQQLRLLQKIIIDANELLHFQQYNALFKHWVSLLNKDLMAFSIQHGQVIRLKDSKKNRYLMVEKSNANRMGFELRMSKYNTVATNVTTLFRIKKRDTSNLSLLCNNEIVLEPIYAFKQNRISSMPLSSKVAFLTTLKRGKKAYSLAIANAQGKTDFVDPYLTISRLNLGIMNDMDVPILGNQLVYFNHKPSGLTLAPHAVSTQRLGVTPLLMQKTANGKQWVKNNMLIFNIEKINTTQLSTIEDKYIEHQLKLLDDPLDATMLINSLSELIGVFNQRSSQLVKEKFFLKFESLFVGRNLKNVERLKNIRVLLSKLAQHKSFEYKKIVIDDYLGQVNNDLIPLGIKFGDVISITSAYHGKRILWVHDESRFQERKSLEVLAGPNGDDNAHEGPQLFQLISPEQKKGIVHYGDQIVLKALFAGKDNIKSLASGQTMWVNTSSISGKLFYEILVGPNNCGQTKNGQQLFFFKQPFIANSLVSKKIPVLPGDKFEWWSKPFLRKVWINQGSLLTKNAHSILVGPNDDSFHGVNRTQNGQQLFSIEPIPKSMVSDIANVHYINKLIKNTVLLDFEQRGKYLGGMIDEARQSPFVSRGAREKLLQHLHEFCLHRNKASQQQRIVLKQLLRKASQINYENLQQDRIKSLLTMLDREAIEQSIDSGLKNAGTQNNLFEQVKGYKSLLQTLKDQNARSKVGPYLAGVEELIKKQDQMNADTLVNLRGLLSEITTTKFPYDVSEYYPKINLFGDQSQKLAFKSKIVRATDQHGLDQITSYKKMLTDVDNMSLDERLEYLRNLKSTFEKKITEVRSMQELLELANVKVLSVR